MLPVSCIGLVLGLVPIVAGDQENALLINSKYADNHEGGGGHAHSLPVDLSALVNNRAFAQKPGDANFDGLHSGYPAQYLPQANFTYRGVDFDFPQYRAQGEDNVLAQGQIITPPRGRYFSIHLLAAAEGAIPTGSVNVTYTDNTTTTARFWWIPSGPDEDQPNPYGGDIIFPYYLTNTSRDNNQSMIYQVATWIDSTKEVASIQLPNVTVGAGTGPLGSAEKTRLHIFAVSLVPATGNGTALAVQHARSTQAWFEGTNKTQIMSVEVNNVGEDWILANHSVQVTIASPGLKTVVPGVINRLRPGDQATVQVGVVNAEGVEAGTTGEATVFITGAGVNVSSSFNATFGIAQYDATYESMYMHETAPWFNNAKFGIFIHWGVYAVPGWGAVGDKEQYAEWYWFWMNLGKNGSKGDFWEYHLKTYGPDVVYDDFIQDFLKEDAFDPKGWVDLFADAGAQYFTQVSKHHEGYALFDIPPSISNRTSVALFPHRNLLKEIFDAADQYQPHLHRTTYFSMPEWFHPDYKPIGIGWWPGGNATNPYNNKTLPYTGYVPVDDYVRDLQLPEMRILADMGTEMMWCDIGGANAALDFAAKYFNDNAARGKQVLINNRCGVPGDFDTPEYARYSSVQLRKWESSLGMDPFSYGYNRATPDDAYMKPQVVVTSLIDIVSKNGNFLLDVGPTANGTIVQVEQDNLRAAGKWIKSHGEAIFNTTYWFITPQEGDAIRFTQTPDAFYILSLEESGATLLLNSPVPYVDGDMVTIVGGNLTGKLVPSGLLANGSLQLNISDEVRAADQYAWVFKIPFGGMEQGSGGNGTGGASRPSYVGAGATATTVSGWLNVAALMLLVMLHMC